MSYVPKCQTCLNEVSWNTSNNKYYTYCSCKCQSNDCNVINKTKQTCLERYGGIAPACDKNIIKKAKNTCKQRYGTENYNNRDKAKKTCLKKFGVPNVKQKHLTPETLISLNNSNWLSEQYVNQMKSAKQIGIEQNVSDFCIFLHLNKCKIKTRSGSLWFSSKSINWFKFLMRKENIFIQHAQNGGEYRIPNTKYHVDGYCEKTNTIYEFYGDYFHGNPEIFESDYYNNLICKTADELYHHTMERENKIRKLGYNLVTMWEHDFDKHRITSA
ncbi:MAG: DUF7487 domain-containing protein [Nitrosopumilaceae archaeon]